MLPRLSARGAWLACVSGVLLSPAVAGAQPANAGSSSPGPRLVYVLRAQWPPFEYVDGSGRPEGFAVELLRTLARGTGAQVEFHVAPSSDAGHELEAGKADRVVLTDPEAGSGRFDVLGRAWTMQQVVAFRPGHPPLHAEDLSRESVAVERHSPAFRL